MAPQHDPQTLHLIGFGAQARAWAQCLRMSGWTTPIYLSRPEGPSATHARELGFTDIQPLSALGGIQQLQGARIAFLCPDALIGSVYRDYLASLDAPLTLILAHGYAVYANDLKPARPMHRLALLAPKAIGPKIWALFQEARSPAHGGTRDAAHRLVAGFHAPAEIEHELRRLAHALGFASENLVPATFEQEAIGDLLSEQGLLCGGLFTLLEWTLQAMKQAGVPPRLIREECLTELELIAGLLRTHGPERTFKTISQAAQCGTVAMKESLETSNAREHFDRRLSQVLDHRFAELFRSQAWKPQAEELARRLGRWQEELSR